MDIALIPDLLILASDPAVASGEIPALFSVESLIALIALTVLEIVLGIDNIVFIAILAGRLPDEKRAIAWRLGLGGAMVMRVLLLLVIGWIAGLTAPFFEAEMLGFELSFSWRDVILLAPDSRAPIIPERPTPSRLAWSR